MWKKMNVVIASSHSMLYAKFRERRVENCTNPVPGIFYESGVTTTFIISSSIFDGLHVNSEISWK
jgi:hypothetical protein